MSDRSSAPATLPLVRSAAEIARWDDEADVVIVGLGCAGACAGLEARAAGADVLVLERGGCGGGTSAMSGGLIYLGRRHADPEGVRLRGLAPRTCSAS